MQNKITTKQTLQKLQENLADKDFRKEFGRLFVDYLDVNNRDNNAYYYKILKLLQDRGLNKEEAESFFKDLRVQNKNSIIKISKIQQDINKLQENYKKNRIKILINPLSVATLVALYYNLYEEIQQNLNKIKEELILKLKINTAIDKKVREIEQIINKNLQGLQEMQQDKEDKALQLNNIYKNTETLQNKLQDLQETLIIQEIKDNTFSGKEKEEKKQKEEIQTQDQQPDQQNNHSSPNQVNKQQSTQAELEDCLKAVADGVNTADKKTLAFYVIGEYLHRGNKEDKGLFEQFDGVLDKKEFNNIVNINKALLTGEIDYSKVKEALDKQGFKGLIELGENVNREQKITDKEKEKNKELGLGQPSKINLNMPSLN